MWGNFSFAIGPEQSPTWSLVIGHKPSHTRTLVISHKQCPTGTLVSWVTNFCVFFLDSSIIQFAGKYLQTEDKAFNLLTVTLNHIKMYDIR